MLLFFIKKMRIKELTFVSIGENCLIDEILKDSKLRTATYPFGSGRFNIEYILEICKEEFEHFLDENFLYYATVENKIVVKNNFYNCKLNIYESSVCNDVEFTHHDVFKPNVRDSFLRKIERFKYATNQPADYVFMYYHRFSSNTDIEKIKELLMDWSDWIEQKSLIKPKIVFIHQELIKNKEERKVSLKDFSCGKEVIFYTLDLWSGPELWSAAKDRDLFKSFFYSKEILKWIYGRNWMMIRICRDLRKYQITLNSLINQSKSLTQTLLKSKGLKSK
jgi:hypothetical protein